MTNSTQSAQYSTGSAHALILTLTLNSSVLSQGQTVSLTIVERNALDGRNNVTSSSNWAFEELGVGPCGSLNYHFGFEVLSGYYTSAFTELDSAQKVQLYQPGAYFCPAMLNVASYSFSPQSDQADVMGGCDPEPCITKQLNSTSTIKEYWNMNRFDVLPVGFYTVVVGDEWGAYLLAHFAVNAPGAPIRINETQLVQVVSTLGPIPPINPGGPTVSITLANAGVTPITYLTATFHFSSNSSGIPTPAGPAFHFNVSTSSPLTPGQSISSKETLIGAGFSLFTSYPLTINGTLEGGIPFTATVQSWINPLAYLEPNTAEGFCHGPTGYDSCVGDGFASAEVFNCSSEAATSSGCSWRLVESAAPRYASEVTVWYPYSRYGEAWNCMITESGDLGNYYGAYCISTNATAFVVSEPAPPPAAG